MHKYLYVEIMSHLEYFAVELNRLISELFVLIINISKPYVNIQYDGHLELYAALSAYCIASKPS